MITVALSQFWVQRLGWTLLHFLWQGTAIVIVYAMLRNRLAAHSLSARGRYILACVALGAMAMAPLLTFLLLPGPHARSVTVVSPQVALWSFLRSRITASPDRRRVVMACGRILVFQPRAPHRFQQPAPQKQPATSAVFHSGSRLVESKL